MRWIVLNVHVRAVYVIPGVMVRLTASVQAHIERKALHSSAYKHRNKSLIGKMQLGSIKLPTVCDIGLAAHLARSCDRPASYSLRVRCLRRVCRASRYRHARIAQLLS